MFSILKAIAAGTVLAAVVVVTLLPAEARDVAKRCSWYGCNYIHCNWTGDRCFRVDENRYGERTYRGYYGYGYGDEYHGGYRSRYYGDGYRRGYRDDGYHRGDYRDRDRYDESPYYRPRHRARDRYNDRHGYSPRRRDYDEYGPDDRYQDRYRYDDRW